MASNISPYMFKCGLQILDPTEYLWKIIFNSSLREIHVNGYTVFENTGLA